jgi:hypothetical protein
VSKAEATQLLFKFLISFMNKKLTITVDADSWPRGVVPAIFKKMAGSWSFDLRHALLHTALRTRPPSLHGFDLNNTWAWLRYGYAFSKNRHLCLRSEWSEIDPHQKTVLSDELGMGLTTYLLSRKLGYTSFHDTLHFIRAISPNALSLKTIAKNGKGKSPDFVAIDKSGKISLIECKGTQTSHRVLESAMKTGIDQKKNVKPKAGNVTHSVVMGLFVPQFSSKENARLHICDPSWHDVSDLLNDASPSALRLASTKLAISRELSFLNLPATIEAITEIELNSNHLDSTSRTVALKEMSVALNRIQSDRRLFDRELTVPSRHGFESFVRGTVSCDRRYLEQIMIALEGFSPESLLRISQSQYNVRWKHAKDGNSATLESPLGFKLSLEISEDLIMYD